MSVSNGSPIGYVSLRAGMVVFNQAYRSPTVQRSGMLVFDGSPLGLQRYQYFREPVNLVLLTQPFQKGHSYVYAIVFPLDF